MHIYFTALFASLLFLSCQNIGSKPRQQNAISAVETSDTESLDTARKHALRSKGMMPELIEGKTMLSGTYRVWEETDNPAVIVDSTWLEIFANGVGVQIQPLSYHITNGFDECAGVKTKSIATHNKTILFVQGSKLKTGSKSAVNVSKELLWPGIKTTFTCHGIHYTLEGKGTISGSETYMDDTEQLYTFHNVTDYSLQLVDQQGNTFTLVNEESFNDTFIELLFVGDLDGDNLPDFIISAPRHYEEQRTLLMLSTDNVDGRVKVYEAVRQFDC